ncbi:MAG TPA: hypothetical protein VG796_28125 [Verrucomicrobiales bacterium]|jgi:hypothetical protein|nr:hypothetical protein [Verrucomicrobiales bacterium]
MKSDLPDNPAPSDEMALQLLTALVKQHKATEGVSQPQTLAASTLALVTGAKESGALEKLTESTLALQKGSLEGVEATLWTQAATLNGMFHDLTQQACTGSMPLPLYETRMKLALRAQAQSARTMEIIANMKQGPKVLFAGQVNTAQQQVVNNGTPTQPEPAERIVRSAKNQNSSRPRARAKPKSLTEPSISIDNALDPRSQRKAAPADKALAAVE